MPAIRVDIKTRCRSTGHTLADLSRATGILYPNLTGALNGYWHLPYYHELCVSRVLKTWDEAKVSTLENEHPPSG